MADVRQYTHYIALDFGTAGCGIAVTRAVTLADEKIAQEIHIFQQWQQGRHSIKCPTIILLDQNLDCVAFGLPARKNYYLKSVRQPNELENFYLFEYFKMSLYQDKVIII